MVKKDLKRGLEGEIHSELYRVIKNLIEKGFRVNKVTFNDILFKPRLRSRKEPDLVLRDSVGKYWLVIETKRRDEGARAKLFDPYSPKVIHQASNYALELGTPYFATCNGKIFVLYKTFEEFVPLHDRLVKHYDLVGRSLKEFVEELLNDLVNLDLGLTKWTPDYQVLVDRFRTLHSLISPYMHTSLLRKLKDKSFRERYIGWLEKEGFEPSDIRDHISSKEAAYLLIDKIIFYKTIQKHHNLPRLSDVQASDLKKVLDDLFDKVTQEIDYVAVFERKQLFNQIPLAREVKELLVEFIEELSHYDFGKIGSDIMGQVYKDLIPVDEKKEFGQYYTDEHVCDLIVKLCVHSPADVVLDPACGSGTFLIKAYQCLKTLKGSKIKDHNKLHNELLKQLWGVEINQFPAHLSVMQMSMQDLEANSDEIHVIVNDFFKTHKENILDALKVVHEGGSESIGVVPEADDVMGNPPYIRQESIKDKSFVRTVALQNVPNKDEFSGRSDLYVYFFVYGYSVLKKNGKFGFITSNSWLDNKYGVALEHFFLKKSQINDLIYFDKNVFDDALVNTCITILTKKKADDEENVKFVRIKKFMQIDDLVKLIKETNEDYEDQYLKVVLIPQKELYEVERWSRFIRAPKIYKKLKANAKLEQLSNLSKKPNERIASVKYSHKLSRKDFFILSKSKARELGIEPEYLEPVITSSRDAPFLDMKKSKIGKYMLLTDLPKSRLQGKKVLKYIEWAEEQRWKLKRGKQKGKELIGYHNAPSLKNKKIWYSFAKREPAPILFPKSFWQEYPIYWNHCAQATDNIYEIRPTEGGDTLVLLAYLNSSLNAFFLEFYGTIPGGRDLALMKEVVERLPVINPATLNEEEREWLEEAFRYLIEVQEKGGNETTARATLDATVFEILGLKKSESKQIIDSLNELRRIRQEGRIESRKVEGVSTARKKVVSKEKYIIKSLHHWMDDERSKKSKSS